MASPVKVRFSHCVRIQTIRCTGSVSANTASHDNTCYSLTQQELASIPPMEASQNNSLLRSDTKPPRLNYSNTFGNATSGHPLTTVFQSINWLAPGTALRARMDKRTHLISSCLPRLALRHGGLSLPLA